MEEEIVNEFAKDIISTIVLALVLLVPVWKVHRKAGVNPGFSLLLFVPYIGLLLVSMALAFSKWPNIERKR